MRTHAGACQWQWKPQWHVRSSCGSWGVGKAGGSVCALLLHWSRCNHSHGQASKHKPDRQSPSPKHTLDLRCRVTSCTASPSLIHPIMPDPPSGTPTLPKLQGAHNPPPPPHKRCPGCREHTYTYTHALCSHRPRARTAPATPICRYRHARPVHALHLPQLAVLLGLGLRRLGVLAGGQSRGSPAIAKGEGFRGSGRAGG